MHDAPCPVIIIIIIVRSTLLLYWMGGYLSIMTS